MGAGSFLHRLAVASDLGTVPDRYFIFCYFAGGWDLLLGLDPRDPDIFRPDRRGDTLIEPGYDLLQDPNIAQEPLNSAVPGMDFGPYIGDLLGWAPQMALVRGMSMDTLTHEVGRRRFITGKAPAGLQARGSSGATVLAGCLGVYAALFAVGSWLYGEHPRALVLAAVAVGAGLFLVNTCKNAAGEQTSTTPLATSDKE